MLLRFRKARKQRPTNRINTFAYANGAAPPPAAKTAQVPANKDVRICERRVRVAATLAGVTCHLLPTARGSAEVELHHLTQSVKLLRQHLARHQLQTPVRIRGKLGQRDDSGQAGFEGARRLPRSFPRVEPFHLIDRIEAGSANLTSGAAFFEIDQKDLTIGRACAV